ncbi:hypothetical protein ABZP36_010225 [Zizania latifolia]
MGWKAAEKLVRHWKILRGLAVIAVGKNGSFHRDAARLRNILSKGKDIQVEFSQLKLHFMFQMFKYLTQSLAGPKDTPIELALEKTYDAKAGIGMPDL